MHLSRMSSTRSIWWSTVHLNWDQTTSSINLTDHVIARSAFDWIYWGVKEAINYILASRFISNIDHIRYAHVLSKLALINLYVVSSVINLVSNLKHQKLKYPKFSIRSICLEIASNEKKIIDQKVKVFRDNLNCWKNIQNKNIRLHKKDSLKCIEQAAAERDRYLTDRERKMEEIED